MNSPFRPESEEKFIEYLLRGHCLDNNYSISYTNGQETWEDPFGKNILTVRVRFITGG